jgi:hypothetical protein
MLQTYPAAISILPAAATPVVVKGLLAVRELLVATFLLLLHPAVVQSVVAVAVASPAAVVVAASVAAADWACCWVQASVPELQLL